MKLNSTTIEVSKETHRRLKIYAITYGFQVSQLGDKILRAFLDKEEEKGKMSQNDMERKGSNIVENTH